MPRFAGGARGRIVTNRLINVDGSTFLDVWTTQSFDGDAAEVWAEAWSAADANEFWYIALLANPNGTNVLDGYVGRLRKPAGNPAVMEFLRYDNQVLSGVLATVNAVFGQPDLALLRREGNDIVLHHSTDAGANWTEKLRLADTNYTTGLYPALGIGTTDATGPAWEYIGGGSAEEFIPQIIRRLRPGA